MNYDRPVPPPKPKTSRRKVVFAVLAAVLVVVYSAVTVGRPFRDLQPSVAKDTLSITTSASSLPWPDDVQGAFGLTNGRVIATQGEQTALPTASAIKLLTALCVLQKYPLSGDASGPTITLGDSDVALYNKYVAEHGSVVPVSDGQRLTERQMLQAVLLPSGNNIADSLVTWAFGSVGAYHTYAANYLKQHGLANTHVGSDASGFSPDSTASASDLVKLGALAMSNPALTTIVGEKTAVIPGVGTVRNVDTLLGSNNIVGVKTGNSDQNTGVFVGAAVATVNGQRVTLISALTGDTSLDQVLSHSRSLLSALQTTITQTTIVKSGTVLGTYKNVDGTTVQAIAAQDLNIVILRGDSVSAGIKLQAISYKAKASQTVGTVSVPKTTFSPAQSVPIVLKQAPVEPSVTYRLTHP